MWCILPVLSLVIAISHAKMAPIDGEYKIIFLVKDQIESNFQTV